MSKRARTGRGGDVREAIVGLLAAIVFVVCVVVVVINQQIVGWPNLLAMLAGLAGLIALLALYNRRWQ